MKFKADYSLTSFIFLPSLGVLWDKDEVDIIAAWFGFGMCLTIKRKRKGIK